MGHDSTPPGSSNTLSGTVLGSAVQAGVIHGSVHFHDGPIDRPPIPRQLPPPCANFTGRSQEISTLDRLLGQGENAIVLLCGPGGVGKSALARQWAHIAKPGFADGQLYVDLRGFSGDEPLDPAEALSAFLRALGVAERQIPVSLAEQAALYRTVTADRSMLVMIDDAFSVAQVRPLLPASASAAVLVTSRRHLTGLIHDGASLIDVAPLPVQDALGILRRVVGDERISREIEPATALAEICGGLPIALTVAAGRLAGRPLLSVRRMVSDLADESERLARLSIDDSSIKTMFEVSYRSLTADAAALYRTLSRHPGPDFSVDLVVALVGAARGIRRRPDEVIDELLGASLLEEVAEDRIGYHDLLRLFARELDDREAEATHGMLEYYLAVAQRADRIVTPYRRRLPYVHHRSFADLPELAGRAEALAWLERERLNLIGAGRAAFALGHFELAWHLSDVCWPLVLHSKNYRDRLEIDERGVRAAQGWGHRWAEADMRKRLSGVCKSLGDHASAARHGLAAAECYRQVGDEQGVLDAEEGLVALDVDGGRRDAAVDGYARILRRRRVLLDARSVGLTCINLGLALTAANRPTEALLSLAEAGEIFAGLADVDPYNGARVLIGLACAHLGVGDLDTAEESAARAADRMAELGSSSEYASAVHVLGQIARRRGDNEAARDHYRRAAAIFERLGSPRLRVVTRHLGELGDRVDPAVVQQGGEVPEQADGGPR